MGSFRALALAALWAPLHAFALPEGLVLLQTRAELRRAAAAGVAVEAKPVSRSTPGAVWGTNYMPKYNTAVCLCAKCSTTSLYNWIFANEFGHSFRSVNQDQSNKDVHNVDSGLWRGLFDTEQRNFLQSRFMDEAFTIAFIRDPKERLVSAWKSKLACGDGEVFGTDTATDRKRLVGALVTLWGKGRAKGRGDDICMPLERFLAALRDIHKDGNASQLNGHFLPQQHGCFARDPPAKWGHVSDIAGPHPYDALATHLNIKDRPKHLHSSVNLTHISKVSAAILDEVTAPEYALLRPYLSRPSRVRAGMYALLREDSEPN